ncbi:MAG TPA: glycosyltransferase family A protein [Vicinamibacterales bacterium]|nr:glycosyltransferase family A protein [Vicinamibacterales bacterium]
MKTRSPGETPTVSVIMPAYNVSAYIGEAISTVRAQTLADFELLIVDDGSTDDTADIVRRFAAVDDRIRLLQQENRGLAAARNTALRNARSGLMALLDSDDLWHPRFLQAQVALLEQKPDVDIVTGNGWTLGSHEDGHPARPWPDPRPTPDLWTILGDELSVFIMSVFRRRVYDTIGGFDEMLRTNEDFDFWLRAALAGFKFARNDEPLGYYRRRDDSLSASQVRMLRGALRVYYKHRPALLHNRKAIRLLDDRVQRFEADLIAAEARDAINQKDFPSVGRHISALRERRGGAKLSVVMLLARWMPGLLWRAYQYRRKGQAAPHGA